MASSAVQRKLTAILGKEGVGYSRPMGEDEAATPETLTACRRGFVSQIGNQTGHVVDAKGDAILRKAS